jgi:acylphosphatase
MRVSFQIHGSVQGVGFRRFAAWEAQRLDLAGWVRNEPDDTLCGEAEGPEAALMAFRARLTLGPTFAAVTRLDWGDADMRSSLPHPFEIRR